jgi:hypothetical protein
MAEVPSGVNGAKRDLLHCIISEGRLRALGSGDVRRKRDNGRLALLGADAHKM